MICDCGVMGYSENVIVMTMMNYDCDNHDDFDFSDDNDCKNDDEDNDDDDSHDDKDHDDNSLCIIAGFGHRQETSSKTGWKCSIKRPKKIEEGRINPLCGQSNCSEEKNS